MNTKFRSFLEHKFSCLWDKDARVWLLTHVASTCLALWETANYLPEWLHHFTSLPALHERPSLSTFFPSWGIITDLKKFFFAALIDNKCAARHHIFNMKTCVSVLSHQSCLTLCDPRDCSPPGSSVHGILQARILEWVAISSFRGSSWPRDQTTCLMHWQAGSLPLAPPRKPQHALLSAHKSGNGLNISKITCPL